jgi:hypothetical protein
MDQSIIDGNAAALERLRSLVGNLSDDDLSRDIGDGWTVAAALAHVAFWDRRALVLLERWERDGVSPSEADADAINDAMLPQWRAIPPRWAAEDALSVAEAVDRKVAALSAEEAQQVRGARSILLERSDHRMEHVAELEQLLA